MILKDIHGKNYLEELYQAGNSMADIAKILNCSINNVVYWMDKHQIKRRSWSEATYLKLNPTGDPFCIKQNLSRKEVLLYGMGLGIYWGEGEKISKGKVRVANTDPKLLLTFRSFLLTICQVTQSRIHYSLVCFNDSNPREVSTYWSNLLEISEEKFGKIVQISPQGKGTYKHKSQYGVCTLEISNIRLKQWLMHELHKSYILPE